jgi:hypothetical protein
MARKAENLSGKVFGELVVIHRTKAISNRPTWLCRCSCGNEKAIAAYKLTLGRTTTCGCGFKGIEDDDTLPIEDVFHEVWKHSRVPLDKPIGKVDPYSSGQSDDEGGVRSRYDKIADRSLNGALSMNPEEILLAKEAGELEDDAEYNDDMVKRIYRVFSRCPDLTHEEKQASWYCIFNKYAADLISELMKIDIDKTYHLLTSAADKIQASKGRKLPRRIQ